MQNMTQSLSISVPQAAKLLNISRPMAYALARREDFPSFQVGNRILARDQCISNDTWKTGLNNNDIIIGPPGFGKTRGYVLPNLLQASESLIITDTKGNLCQQVGPILEKRGYRVYKINLADCEYSQNGYNPLDFIRVDYGGCFGQDVLTVAAALVPVEIEHDSFWDHAARSVLAGIIAYVMEHLPSEEQTIDSVIRLFCEMGTGKYNNLMKELVEIEPDCFPAVQYRMFSMAQAADKMYASIQDILAEKLTPFSFPEAQNLLNHPKKIDIARIAERRTAIFLHISDTDRSMDRMASLFSTQALQTLCASADKRKNSHLRTPVRFILDDFAAADACIPDFDRITSVIRSRGISVSIILQSLPQLEASYGHEKSMTILNNCDHLLYLGG
nr:type IV secretory system conjugative DNA transfer family protein [uncultured Oscillibacter sp.]